MVKQFSCFEWPYNNEMKQTKPAMARMARSSLLISVLSGRNGSVRELGMRQGILFVAILSVTCGRASPRQQGDGNRQLA